MRRGARLQAQGGPVHVKAPIVTLLRFAAVFQGLEIVEGAWLEFENGEKHFLSCVLLSEMVEVG